MAVVTGQGQAAAGQTVVVNCTACEPGAGQGVQQRAQLHLPVPHQPGAHTHAAATCRFTRDSVQFSNCVNISGARTSGTSWNIATPADASHLTIAPACTAGVSFETAPACNATACLVKDTLGRCWGWEGGRSCAFKDAGGTPLNTTTIGPRPTPAPAPAAAGPSTIPITVSPPAPATAKAPLSSPPAAGGKVRLGGLGASCTPAARCSEGSLAVGPCTRSQGPNVRRRSRAQA